MAMVFPEKFYRDPSNSFQALDAYENSCQGCDNDVIERVKWPNGEVRNDTRCRACQKVYPNGNAQKCHYWTKKRGW